MGAKANKSVIWTCNYVSPCGELVLGAVHGRLCLCDWLSEKHRDAVCRRLRKGFKAEFREISDVRDNCLPGSEEYLANAVLARASAELDEYFDRKRTEFTLPLALTGTGFQKKVWNELLAVPYGETISYKEQAFRVGEPSALRAVASANGMNAISVFVPCHRVIGSDNSLTGYGGGLKAKRYLLDLEQKTLFDI